jgi:hypothetical protein
MSRSPVSTGQLLSTNQNQPRDTPASAGLLSVGFSTSLVVIYVVIYNVGSNIQPIFSFASASRQESIPPNDLLDSMTMRRDMSRRVNSPLAEWWAQAMVRDCSWLNLQSKGYAIGEK